jgi:hypothetical protein
LQGFGLQANIGMAIHNSNRKIQVMKTVYKTGAMKQQL